MAKDADFRPKVLEYCVDNCDSEIDYMDTGMMMICKSGQTNAGQDPLNANSDEALNLTVLLKFIMFLHVMMNLV